MDNEEYGAWRNIDYRPAVSEVLPLPLLPLLPLGGEVLDIGCGKGDAAVFLARNGHQVLGIDLGADSLAQARKKAAEEGLGGARFEEADILEADLGGFDAVILIRALTCFSEEVDWGRLLGRVDRSIRPGGFLYLNDFMRSDENEIYRRRYEAGETLGWRPGNFAVEDGEGEILFVAHHHSPEELARIEAPYERRLLRFYDSLSLNGNRCSMVEYIGRKPDGN